MLVEYPVDLIADPPNGFKDMNLGNGLITNPGFGVLIPPFMFVLLLNYFPLME